MNSLVSEPRIRLPGVVYHPPAAARRYVAEGVWQGVPLGEVIHRDCVRFLDNKAIIGPAGILTFREMDEVSDRFAVGLLNLGLRPLDSVIFQMPNIPETQVALYGCLKAGILPLCTIAAHREHEIGNLGRLVRARAHLIYGQDPKFDFPAFARKMRKEIPSLEYTIAVEGERGSDSVSYVSLLANVDATSARQRIEALDVDPFQVAMFQLSGGSTGLAKVTPRFHSEYAYHTRLWADGSAFDQQTVTFWPLPAMHNAAMSCFTIPTHLNGGAVVLIPWSTPKDVFGIMMDARPTVTGLAGPHIARAKAAGILDKLDLTFIRQCFSTAHAALIEREIKVPGYHLFGMAEGINMRTVPSDPLEVRTTTIGKAMSPLESIRLVDPQTGIEVEEGQIGEMRCRGPYTVCGYFNDPEGDAARFDEQGYLKSGDLMSAVVVDGTRYFEFKGRLKDNIDRGAEKIGAKDVEDAVIQHPSVLDVAALGMPDPEMGERVCVYIVVVPGARAPDKDELGKFLEGLGLAKYKWPERVEVVAEFPVTKVGKVSKDMLKADVSAKLRAEEGGAA
jgi:2,3-dihydroxybenzoate-AMP ligase